MQLNLIGPCSIRVQSVANFQTERLSMPSDNRRLKLTLTPALDHSLRVLGLNARIDPNDGVPVDGVVQVTSALARYADAIEQASRDLDRLFDRAEWNLIADVLNGCADLWEWSERPMSSLTLIRAEIEDGHRLNRLGYKWFGEDDPKASDA